MFMWKNCNIYVMEMIESIVWTVTGFISTLVTMEVAWRLAKAQARKVSVTKPGAMEQEVRDVIDIDRFYYIVRFVPSDCI